jgi:NADH:ubiquinone oxidoreductase subunit 5 (subunit L)/multisubunit Na+/H+ antiporter MnhA subunit
MGGEQDMRKMGGLKASLPVTHFTFLIGTIAIAGLPPLAGFFSKDEILAAAYHHSPVLWILGVGGALLTAFYMFRLYFLTFHGSFRGTEHQKHHLHESPLSITLPLIVLAILSAVAGFVNVPAVLGGNHWLGHFFEPLLAGSIAVQELHPHDAISHTLEIILMCVSAYAVYQYTQQEDFAAPVRNKKIGDVCNNSGQCPVNASCNNGKCAVAGTGFATNKTFVSSQQSISDCGRQCTKNEDCKQIAGCDKCTMNNFTKRGTCTK